MRRLRHPHRLAENKRPMRAEARARAVADREREGARGQRDVSAREHAGDRRETRDAALLELVPVAVGAMEDALAPALAEARDVRQLIDDTQREDDPLARALLPRAEDERECIAVLPCRLGHGIHPGDARI